MSIIKGQKEAKFRDAFFRCPSINSGLEAAAKMLGCGRDQIYCYFMDFIPSVHDVRTAYIYACRYKALYDQGVTQKKIAISAGYCPDTIHKAIKVVNTFRPNQINPELPFSAYQDAIYTKDPFESIKRRLARQKKKQSGYPKQRLTRYIEKVQKASEFKKAGKPVKEIADIMNVSMSTASRLVQAGNIPLDVLQKAPNITAIKEAIFTDNPTKYLQTLTNPVDEPKEEQEVKETAPKMLSVNEQLEETALGILKMLTEYKRLENFKESHEETIQSLHSKMQEQQETIRKLRKENAKLQELNSRQNLQFKGVLKQLNQVVNLTN